VDPCDDRRSVSFCDSAADSASDAVNLRPLQQQIQSLDDQRMHEDLQNLDNELRDRRIQEGVAAGAGDRCTLCSGFSGNSVSPAPTAPRPPQVPVRRGPRDGRRPE
jgi:hypothetical protein